MNQNNAVAEALERLAESLRDDKGDFKPVLMTPSEREFLRTCKKHLPTIIAALKAQRVDGGGVS